MLVIALLYWFWLFYIAFVTAMGAKNAWPQLGFAPKCLLAPVALAGAIMDVIFNTVFATVLMADLPREWLFTHRLDRYELNENGGWRHRFAIWFCTYWLNPFQQGGHCVK